MPRPRENLSEASTTLASIRTCGVCVSTAFTSAVASWMTDGMSLMMSVLVRSSTFTEPRLESRRLVSFSRSFALAKFTGCSFTTRSSSFSRERRSCRRASRSDFSWSTGAMRRMFPIRTKPRPFVSRMTSSAWSQGTSTRRIVTLPVTS